jgi:hypothetical protein
MLRGIEVRGSDRTPGVPRALGIGGEWLIAPKPVRAEAERDLEYGPPGADQTTRAAKRWLFDNRRRKDASGELSVVAAKAAALITLV